MADYKKRPTSHVIEQESIDALRAILPSEWIYDKPTDYGIDLDVQIVEGDRVTGKKLCLQVKATEKNVNFDKLTFSMDLSDLKLYEEIINPVVIIYAVTDQKRSFWKFYHIFAQEYINEALSKENPEWRLNKSDAKNPKRTIRFTKDSKLTDEKPLATIADQGRFYVSKLLLKDSQQLVYLDGIPSSDNENLKDLLNQALQSEIAEKHRDTIETLEKALRLHNIVSTERMALLINLGNAYLCLSENEKAFRHYENVLELAGKVDNKSALKGKSCALGNIGLIYCSQGYLDEAIKCQMKALKFDQNLKNSQGEASVLVNLGNIYYSKGDHHQAIRYYRDAIAIQKKTNRQDTDATIIGNIGLIYLDIGDWEKALKYSLDSLQINRKTKSKFGEAYQLAVLAQVYDEMGEIEKAFEYCQKALEMSRQIFYYKAEAAALNVYGNIHVRREELKIALDYYQKSLELFRKINIPQNIAYQFGNISNVYRLSEKYDIALRYQEKALEIFKECGFFANAEKAERIIAMIKEEQAKKKK